jgi:hypothetical protein
MQRLKRIACLLLVLAPALAGCRVTATPVVPHAVVHVGGGPPGHVNNPGHGHGHGHGHHDR